MLNTYKTIPLRNVKYWLKRLGTPQRLPPLAWCDDGRMTVVVPSGGPSGGKGRTSAKPEDTSRIVLGGYAGWSWDPTVLNKTNHHIDNCKANFQKNFFTIRKRTRIDAWLASARYETCGGRTIQSNDYSYFINVFRPPGTMNHVMVTFACPTQTGTDNYAQCLPTARWEATTSALRAWAHIPKNSTLGSCNDEPVVTTNPQQIPSLSGGLKRTLFRDPSNPSNDSCSQADTPREHIVSLPDLGKASFGGSVVSASLTAGLWNDFTITTNDSRLIFESHSFGDDLYPWPMLCEVRCLSQDLNAVAFNRSLCMMPIIVQGCPVSSLLDFRTHVETSDESQTSKNPDAKSRPAPSYSGSTNRNDATQRPGSIVFSFVPFVFQNDEKLDAPQAISLRCLMETFDTPPKVTDFCNKRIILSSDSKINTTESTNEAQEETKTRCLQASGTNKIKRRGLYSSSLDNCVRIQKGASSSHCEKENQYKRDMNNLQPENRLLDRSLLELNDNPAKWKSFDGDDVTDKHFATISEKFAKQDAVEQRLKAIENAIQSAPAMSSHDAINATGRAPEEVLEGQRYVPEENRVIEAAQTSVVYGSYAAQWGWDREERAVLAAANTQDALLSLQLDLTSKAQATRFAYQDLSVSTLSDRQGNATGFRQVFGAAVAKGNYGVALDRSNAARATAVEVSAKAARSGTLIDLLDRDYGQSVKVRDFELSARHDFDEFINPATDTSGTEVFLTYRSVAVALGFDVTATDYALSVGVRNYQYAFRRNFESRFTNFQGNWGNGWQMVIDADMPDELSNRIYGRFGYGKLGRAYASAGVGVGEDGLPLGLAEVATEDMGLGVEFLEFKGTRVFLYTVIVGKFAYTWESRVVPDNIKIPLALEANPSKISPLTFSP